MSLQVQEEYPIMHSTLLKTNHSVSVLVAYKRDRSDTAFLGFITITFKGVPFDL